MENNKLKGLLIKHKTNWRNPYGMHTGKQGWRAFPTQNHINKTKRVLMLLLQCRLIVSTMSSQRCQTFNVMLYPICAFLLIVPFIKSVEIEMAILVLYTAGVAIFHVHYGIFLVSSPPVHSVKSLLTYHS